MKNRESSPQFSNFGAEALLERIDWMRKEIGGVRKAEEIEFVHRMRVASRRLRTALAIFEETLPAKKSRNWGKRIKRVTKGLGEARDTDVQIDFVRRLASRLAGGPEEEGIDRLLLRLKQAREAIQPEVLSALDKLNKSGVLNKMEREMRRIAEEGRKDRPNGSRLTLLEKASHNINPRLVEFLSYEHHLGGEEPAAELHDMRIAAKRLRYTMEMFAPLYGESFGEFIKAVRKAQTLLGDLHDCNVWLERLPVYLTEESRRTEEYFGHLGSFDRLMPGFLALEEDRRIEQENIYAEFRSFWKEQKERETWDAIRRSPMAPVERKMKSA
jgi:CHAD domain-containing protein